MNLEQHPAHRPTRYHWAAGLNPWHWVPALGAWMAVGLLGLTAVLSGGAVREGLAAAASLLSLAALCWTGYWLIAVPMMPRFRRATDARLAAQYEGDYDYRCLELRSKIHADLREHVADISELRNRARELLQQKFGAHDPFARDNLTKLDTLAISYLQMLATLTEYDAYVSLVNPQSIERDLQAARQQAAETSPSLAELGRKQVELLENRLARYDKAKEVMRLLQVQLKNVETTMKLLVDQAMTAADPQRVGRDIDLVLRNISDSEVLSAELSAYNDLEREIDLRRAVER